MANFLPRLIRLILRAGWAPFAVVVFHGIVGSTSYRHILDFPIHFSGGMAIAYFFLHSLTAFESLFGISKPAGQYLASYALACTTGLFWEFAEYASDVWLGTNIQIGIEGTMSDLIADASGACLSLLLCALSGGRRQATGGQGI